MAKWQGKIQRNRSKSWSDIESLLRKLFLTILPGQPFGWPFFRLKSIIRYFATGYDYCHIRTIVRRNLPIQQKAINIRPSRNLPAKNIENKNFQTII